MDFQMVMTDYKTLINKYPNLTKDEFKWLKGLSNLLISEIDHILESWDV